MEEELERKDYWDLEVEFCGWKTSHKFHFAVDLLDHSPLFECPGYEGESLNEDRIES